MNDERVHVRLDVGIVKRDLPFLVIHKLPVTSCRGSRRTEGAVSALYTSPGPVVQHPRSVDICNRFFRSIDSLTTPMAHLSFPSTSTFASELNLPDKFPSFATTDDPSNAVNLLASKGHFFTLAFPHCLPFIGESEGCRVRTTALCQIHLCVFLSNLSSKSDSSCRTVLVPAAERRLMFHM